MNASAQRPVPAPGRAQEMTMIRKASVAAIVALTAAAAPVAIGETTSAPIGEARYSFHKVTDGFLRLDRQTGEVALCGSQPVGWACVTAPEDRAALENEISRLRRDNAALKRELLAHGLTLPPGIKPEPPPANSEEPHVVIRLPDSADIGRMVALAGKLWRQFLDAIVDAQNRMEHKS
jgi:hypothetical protein